MPAVPLPEVQERARLLLEAWARGGTEALHRALDYTWQRYGFRGYRPGRTQPADDLPAYHVPRAALHLLAQAWNTRLEDPARREAFLQALWRHPVLESRHVAVLTWAAGPPPQEADVERFWAWYQDARETPTLRRVLLEHMAPRLVQHQSQAFAQALFRRLEQARAEDLPLLLPVLLPLLEKAPGDWFLPVRQRLSPWLRPPAEHALPEWAQVLLALFRRWPGETLPWLRHLAVRYPGPQWAWLFRRLYPWLEEPWKQRVRQLAREA